MQAGYCPECDTLIDREILELGEILDCPECGVDLVVASIDPVEFDFAPLDEEPDDFEYYDGEEWQDADVSDGSNGNGDDYKY
jgi:alpha-aminoadipate carrier protein LysW